MVHAKALIGGEWRESSGTNRIRDPYRGDAVGSAPVSSQADLDAALNAALDGRAKAAAMPGYERAALLRRAARLIEGEDGGLAQLMARETGKAIKDCAAEIRRSLETIDLSAEEAIRIEGRHVPLDGSAMGAGKLAFLLRFPVGVVAAITPFNAPFNLAAHKIAPSIAAGNAMVLKPPPQAPLLSVHRLVELFVQAGLPSGMLNVVYGGAELGSTLVSDARVDFITFTGSSRAGAAIKAASGLRRVALELGGNNVTIVHEDADLATAATACARNSMRLAGQSCISVQSVYVHKSVYQKLVNMMTAEVKQMRLGDPLDPATDIGTLIDEHAARRVEAWVQEAAAQGASICSGGRRHGAAYEATLLTGVTPKMKVVCEEVWPVVNVMPYEAVEEAFNAINASPYGLQAGVFTRSNELSFQAIRSLRVGGVIINGTSTWRTDQLAYGGVKASGSGRTALCDRGDDRTAIGGVQHVECPHPNPPPQAGEGMRW